MHAPVQVPAAAVVAERDAILDELRRAWDGDPWHGDSLARILEGVTAEQARARPLPAAHSIAEIVLHLAGWTREVARRLRDRVARMPEEGDWPRPENGEDAWRAAKERLGRAHAELIEAVAAFPPAELGTRITDERDRALGVGETYAVMLHGVAQHHAYHAGQIALLKKAFGG